MNTQNYGRVACNLQDFGTAVQKIQCQYIARYLLQLQQAAKKMTEPMARDY